MDVLIKLNNFDKVYEFLQDSDEVSDWNVFFPIGFSDFISF